MSRSRQPRMTRLLRADGATVLSNLLDPSRRRISTAVSARIFAQIPGNVTRRHLLRPTFLTRYDSEHHLHTPLHRRSLPAAFARPSTFLAIRNPPPTPSATARYTLSQTPHQHTSQNACCHVPFSYFSHRTSYDSKHLVPRLTHVSYQTVNTYKTKGVFSGLTGWSRDAPPPFK